MDVDPGSTLNNGSKSGFRIQNPGSQNVEDLIRPDPNPKHCRKFIPPNFRFSSPSRDKKRHSERISSGWKNSTLRFSILNIGGSHYNSFKN